MLRQDGHAHTEHYEYRVKASVVSDMRARVVVVVVCTAGKRSDETEFVSRYTGRQAQL